MAHLLRPEIDPYRGFASQLGESYIDGWHDVGLWGSMERDLYLSTANRFLPRRRASRWRLFDGIDEPTRDLHLSVSLLGPSSSKCSCGSRAADHRQAETGHERSVAPCVGTSRQALTSDTLSCSFDRAKSATRKIPFCAGHWGCACLSLCGLAAKLFDSDLRAAMCAA